ncbi:hypothetical protein BJV74DRAFT_158114 [Russula compacta]|nr:hypothetical protein BJV74DRAFT_158114 [Russula compacta]
MLFLSYRRLKLSILPPGSLWCPLHYHPHSLHLAMSACPLSGASYHTLEAPLHSFDNVDPEALGSLDAYVSEKKFIHSSNILMPLLDQHIATRRPDHRGPPILLALLIFSCLAFVGSAFWSCFPHRLPLPDVPDRHAPFVDYLSVALQTQPYRTLINENYDGALEMMGQNFKYSLDGRRQANLRDYLLRTFPLAHLSLNSTYVAESAVILHWQGTDSNLKPVLITNSDAVLDVRTPAKSVQVSGSSSPSTCGDNEIDHLGDLANIQSGIGMLIATETLLRFGYQPSRTLILSLMLGEASDAQGVSEYLHATYGELGLSMEFEPHVPECKNGRFGALRIFRSFTGRVSRAILSLHPASAASRCMRARPFDDDEPRLFRCIFSPTINRAMLTRLRMQATRPGSYYSDVGTT